MIKDLRYVNRVIAFVNPNDIANPIETELKVLQYQDKKGNWKDVLYEEFLEYEKYDSTGKLLEKKIFHPKKPLDTNNEE